MQSIKFHNTLELFMNILSNLCLLPFKLHAETIRSLFLSDSMEHADL